jgi:7-cyano-7-deazaguanosine (preQ0) biosynthesis protein QueE
VRTGGRDYSCSWCDTLYAVLREYRDKWTPTAPAAIMARVNELAGGKPVLVPLSGGNPALQPLAPLIALGPESGHSFALETQGSISQPWFAELDWLILAAGLYACGCEFPIGPQLADIVAEVFCTGDQKILPARRHFRYWPIATESHVSGMPAIKVKAAS